MSFPRYPEYKDSGVEWLGEVPIHWEVSPFKWLLDRNDGGVWGDDPDGTDDTLVLRSTEQTVDGRWRLESAATRKLSTTEREAALLESGDLVVTKSSGSSLHIGKTTLVTDEIAQLGCCYSNFMQRLRMKPSFSPSLAWYILNNDIARLQFDLLSNSTTGLANLNGTMIGQIMLVIPPGEEQTAIATFLEHETAKIDALVAEQEKLIALLQEKRQAVISHAVTKGLDPNVPMKDSGVEWLGEVPAHWGVGGLTRFIGPVVDYRGRTPTKVDEGIFLVTARNIRDGRIDYEASEEFVDPDSAASLLARGKPEIDDLLFTMEAPLGQVALIDRTDIALAQRVVKFRGVPTLMRNSYLLYWLMSTGCQSRLETLATGSTALGIKASKLGMIECLAPPLDEQDCIVALIKHETTKLDALITEAHTAITLLQERRTALISAAVTGQIDVRGATTPC